MPQCSMQALRRAGGALAERRGLFTSRRRPFRWMQRNSPTAVEYVMLPPERVVARGTQLRLEQRAAR
jgi:hypothetical protein